MRTHTGSKSNQIGAPAAALDDVIEEFSVGVEEEVGRGAEHSKMFEFD